MSDAESAPKKGRHSPRFELDKMFLAVERGQEIGNSWREEALCAEYAQITEDYDLWFSDEGSEESQDAANICSQCPVREICLKWALATNQEYGIYGGLTASERNDTHGKKKT